MDIAWQVESALYKKGGMDLYGEAKYEFAAQIKMGVVSFVDSIDKTSVRADSSASRGKAEIALFDAVFIVPLSASIAQEDVLIVNGKASTSDGGYAAVRGIMKSGRIYGFKHQHAESEEGPESSQQQPESL